jgi:hypothetical protein
MSALLYWSLWALLVGSAAALAWHGAFVYLAMAGFLGLWASAALYLWAAVTGRIDPFPLCPPRDGTPGY